MTSVISSQPKHKSFVENTSDLIQITLEQEIELQSDTGKIELKRVTKSTGDKWLWTGESTHCVCTHHVEQHCTVRDQSDQVVTIHCHGTYEDNKYCNCGLFRPYCIRMDSVYSNSKDNATLAEDLEHV
jgi:hypothetical protein